ncbi:unnamed protein product [Didymodactylos carnosus]|uniref:Uncharacterized protein n=1 Tax=Didymodactylos carnosus TaxID=1234261 RepID=A0A814E0K6_9BILA|nr:unnamed protein product [Didymodactylos carnosus]CAF0962624.1 unnamed protein product [Didymodactylos carnosus]CAF3638613.1 unnamed protein product [Didymodactylos carnosus]CAF3737021.1 unnamed protein product [Didymodactylos carnosus]
MVSRPMFECKHAQKIKDAFESKSLTSGSTSDPGTTAASFVTVSNNSEQILTHDEKICRSESLWLLETTRHEYNYNLNDNMSELYPGNVSDSNIARDFTMISRKLSYVISHSIGQYFTGQLVKHVKNAQGYTPIFDETVIVGMKKQLDLHQKKAMP